MRSKESARFLFFTLKIFFITTLLLNFNISIVSAGYNILSEDLQSKNFHDRLSAVNAVGNMKDEKAVYLLIDFLSNKNEDWRIQIKAIRILGEIKDPRAVSILLEYFDNVFLNYDCPAIKWNTALALGNYKNDSRVFDALINKLSYDNLMVKEAVIESLGKIGNKGALVYLLPFLNEKSFALKYRTLLALQDIVDQSAIPNLKKFITNEKDPILKKEALKLIQKLR